MAEEKNKLVALVLRHGNTDANNENIFRSRLDPHLNKEGAEQAEAAAEFINENYDIYKIISSPLLRAMETADICAEALALDVEQDRALISWALGDSLTGKNKKLYADILDYYVDNPNKTPPLGEPLESLVDRTKKLLDVALHKPKGIVLYVTHSSNVLTMGLLLDKEAKGRQEAEELVGPGGVMAIYSDNGSYKMKTVFGEDRKPEFGS